MPYLIYNLYKNQMKRNIVIVRSTYRIEINTTECLHLSLNIYNKIGDAKQTHTRTFIPLFVYV